MAAKKFAISVPEEVMEQVDALASRQGVTRSRLIADVLRKLARARSDEEITRRVNALFRDPAIAAEQCETARAFQRGGAAPGTEW